MGQKLLNQFQQKLCICSKSKLKHIKWKPNIANTLLFCRSGLYTFLIIIGIDDLYYR